MPDAIDQSWSFLDPATAARLGIKVVCMYLSHDASKDATAAKIRAYHAVGIAVVLNWESQPGRPLLGNYAGTDDGRDAAALVDQLIREVGYAPKNKLAIPFSCDTDTNSSQWANIAGYYYAAGIAMNHRYIVGVYGEADLCDYLSRVGATGMEWQTYAWSNGRLSDTADLYQYQNGQTVAGASVDFDRVIHGPALGAWWPPNHPYNSASVAGAVPLEEGPFMALTDAEQKTLLADVAQVTAFVKDLHGNLAPTRVDRQYLKDIHDHLPALRTAMSQVAGLVTAVAAVKSAASQVGTVDGKGLAKDLIAEFGAALTNGSK